MRILKSALDNTLFQESFERIIGLFATLSFHDHNLLVFMKKLGPEKKVRIIEVRIIQVMNVCQTHLLFYDLLDK